MNRFKKELRKRGIDLECDHAYLPSDEDGDVIAGVIVEIEIARVRIFRWISGWHYYDFDTNMKATEVT